MVFKFDKRVNPKWDKKPFDREVGGAFDQIISFSKGGAKCDGTHDLVEWSNFPCRMSRSKPEG